MDNQLAPAERARLDAHLRECDRCRTSLESLRWSVSLLKQAPVPAASRQFTLPVTRTEPRTLRPSFGFLRAVTALATLLLCAVVSFDLFTQFSAVPAFAPVPAAQFAAPAPTQNIALAPASAPTSSPLTVAPAATTAPTSAAAPPRPTVIPPQAASQPGVLPTATRALSAGAAEAQATAAQADQALKSSDASPAAPPAPRAAITNTVALPSPSPTFAPSATLSAPTATTQAQARVEPTRGRDANAEPVRGVGTPLRVFELGLLVLTVVLGALTIRARRRK